MENKSKRNKRQDFLFIVIILILMIVLALISPDPRGYGTHRKLLFFPCNFLHFTGKPCPTCGLTTSASELLHFNFKKSIRAHIGGIPVVSMGIIYIFYLIFVNFTSLDMPEKSKKYISNITAFSILILVFGWGTLRLILLFKKY